MIIGVGTDLIDIRRIENTLERFKDRFINRVYSIEEKEKVERRAHVANGYAMRYAAKEAAAKALGTGFRDGVFWRDLVNDNLPSGKPVMTFRGGAKERLEKLLPEGMEAQIDVSLTDEYPMAHAIVIISAVPKAVGA
ncbi:holo-(acyl-carrier-protein) synthase 1 [Candidatus Terasakiella magnetica]|uniref:Holo-[acyl-carrier-protein] synthase n=1 Tax=Candidatus Terasakiella magnetica TaxID=1867952 RepID=A0A1C3RCU4_9PROT|nr:holo-ACP synthase [Candidatus Terasakiella magnetica]SCA55093.1 holo-(acyl-carrier-protein) synthase 1 [Candidatus Terasakiella magnetica]